MAASKPDVIRAYRHLYQHLLRAVQYSSPARYVIRDRLRDAFRSPKSSFEPARIANTLEFLHAAGKFRALEHRILKNMVFVAWTRGRYGDLPTLKKQDLPVQAVAFESYDETVSKLNETLGTCL